MRLRIREATDQDTLWLRSLIEQHWGIPVVTPIVELCDATDKRRRVPPHCLTCRAWARSSVAHYTRF